MTMRVAWNDVGPSNNDNIGWNPAIFLVLFTVKHPHWQLTWNTSASAYIIPTNFLLDALPVTTFPI